MTDNFDVNVLFFAILKERAGKDSHSISIPTGTSTAEFRQLLHAELPDLPDGGSSMLVAVNKEYAFDEEIIPEGAEIALFPPVSGG
jgi:molybdopterin converting factor subunit 1